MTISIARPLRTASVKAERLVYDMYSSYDGLFTIIALKVEGGKQSGCRSKGDKAIE